jgi:flagellin
MTTVINTNVPAIIAKSNMDRVQRELESSINKLSSGSRINKAADDAAGMAVANRMESQIRGLTMAIRHGKDGQNLVDTADGAQIEISNMLQRLRELAVQAASDTLDTNNRTFLNAEATALKAEINRISEQTTWNNLNLLDGTYTGKVFQVGFKGAETIDVTIDDAASDSIGAFNMHSIGHAAIQGATTSATSITATTMSVSGYLGSAQVSIATDTTGVNSSVKQLAADINSVKTSTGVEATAITKAKLHAVTDSGVIKFSLAGNHTTNKALTATATFYAVTATLADQNDLDPLADAINKHAANTGITAKLGDTAAELILTHQTGETIELRDIHVGGVTSKNLKLLALDKFGNDTGAADTTLNRATNTAQSEYTTTNTAANRHAYVLGTVTLTSIKNFTVAGDHATANSGYFGTENSMTGQTASGGTAKLSSVASLSVADQEHASDAIAVLDAAIAKIDAQRADLGAISNRLSSVVDNNTSMVTNTESSKSHILDTDFAVETTKLTRTQILQQAATSMLAQANASKQSVLALLQNLG